RDASLDLLRREAVDVLVWPELSINRPMHADDLEKFLRNEMREIGASTGKTATPLIAGVVLKRPTVRSPARVRRSDAAFAAEERLSNAAILAMPDGSIHGIYEKRTLVP